MIRIGPQNRIFTIPGIGLHIITPGGAAWSPTDIAGCQLWLKADAGTYQDAAMTTPASIDTDPVGGWQDQSGSGNHVTQTTAGNKPALKLNIKNGLPVTRFDGGDYLIRAIAASTSLISVFAVTQTAAAAGTVYQQRLEGNATPIKGALFIETNLWRARHRNDATAIKTLTGANSGLWNAWGIVWNNINMYLYQNGVLGASDAIAGVTTIDKMIVGADNNTGAGTFGTYLTGDIAEIVVYNSALSDANRILVETYLNSRYAIW